ncbi:TIGR00366 family protein [Brachyspira hyodysenteriae]|nr:TIGR00366 family protein [Brachyspira hyodysenteriae]MCZ9990855.1 TIGR00366 family protein [Brachyspira hyodysenteriae]MDA0007659.1 TIGR00366 family protein [Brachyspira hyodysenteriae]MDA0030489.1 TIGR00366 family protein [Brachyspira hyodysenteriae]MDA0039574.1 TIGR00366 family protein [Brachyspira hyodysenteriae]
MQKIDYRLLIASAYSGFVLWHAGFSGSIPLTLAGGDLKATGGSLSAAVPVNDTLFSGYNLFIILATFIILPIINALMHPKREEDIISVDPKLFEEVKVKNITKEDFAQMTPAEKIENSIVINLILSIMGFIYIIYHFVSSGKLDLNLNIVNLIFLMLGIILHKTPRSLLNAFTEATKGAAGIVLQFPLYAGIMGLMTGVSAQTGTSLAMELSNVFVSISNKTTFPLFTFLSAGIVNFFVPSGGGQWAVQGSIMMPAAAQIGVDPAKAAMAIAYGDSWTNMIQPFWALPALGIAKLGAKDIMGYTLIVLVVVGIIITAGLLIPFPS